MGFLNILDSLFGLKPRDKIAPVIQSPSDRVQNQDYRYANDPKYIFRIEQTSPKGLPKKVKGDVDIDGISKPQFRQAVTGFILGNKRQLALAKDTENKVDKKLVKVVGRWEDHKGKVQKGQLGWLPKKIMPEIELHLKKPMGATVKLMSKPIEKRPPKITIDLWRALSKKK